MRLHIKITKEVLIESMYCGTPTNTNRVVHSCAFAVALRELFPLASVGLDYIDLDSSAWISRNIITPKPVAQFILFFDSLKNNPEQRLNIPEQSFYIDIPDAIIDKIGLSQVNEILSKSFTLSKSECL